MSSIKKVMEVLASSEKSFEDALQNALTEAGRSVGGIRSIYIKDQSCRVRDNRISEYRITAKVTYADASPQNADGHPSSASAQPAPTAAPMSPDGTPDYRHVHLNAAPEAPIEDVTGPGGSATEAESGGGYSG